MPISAEMARARGKKAALDRCIKNGERQPDDPEYIAAQRDLKTAKLASYIERLIATEPSLTNAQLETLAALFNPRRSA